MSAQQEAALAEAKAARTARMGELNASDMIEGIRACYRLQHWHNFCASNKKTAAAATSAAWLRHCRLLRLRHWYSFCASNNSAPSVPATAPKGEQTGAATARLQQWQAFCASNNPALPAATSQEDQEPGASAAVYGVLVYGTRRIYAGKAGLYKRDFEAWAAAEQRRLGGHHGNGGLHAAFAFPDPVEAGLYHNIFWGRGDLSTPGLTISAALDMGRAKYCEAPDTFYVYGRENTLESVGAGAECHRHVPLAGYIRRGYRVKIYVQAHEKPQSSLFPYTVSRMDCQTNKFSFVRILLTAAAAAAAGGLLHLYCCAYIVYSANNSNERQRRPTPAHDWCIQESGQARTAGGTGQILSGT